MKGTNMRRIQPPAHATLLFAAVALSGALSGCSTSNQDDRAHVAADASGTAAGAELRALNLGGDIQERRSPATAAGDGMLFVYAGRIVDEREAVRLTNDGVIYNAGDGSVTQVPAWPLAAPPYEAAAVFTGSEFLVVGTPCPGDLPSTAEDVDCGGNGLGAAAFDPLTGKWREVTAPSATLDLPKSITHSFAYGVSDGVALFRVGRGDSEIVAYDLRSDEWGDYGLLTDEGTVCSGGSNLYRSHIAGDGSIATERLDAASGEWSSQARGQLESTGTANSFLECGYHQTLFVDYSGEDGSLSSFAWFEDESGEWVSLPAPRLTGYDGTITGIDLPSSKLIWPSSESGKPQMLADGADTWESIDGYKGTSPRMLLTTNGSVFVIDVSSKSVPGTVWELTLG